MKPDYAGGSIVNLMESIRRHYGLPLSSHPPLRLLDRPDLLDNDHIVLIVIDGLGHDYLVKHARSFSSHLLGSITSVFPSATAPAITSFATGVAPAEHGVSGWQMHVRELGSVVEILPFSPRWGDVSFAAAGLRVESLLDAEPLADELPVSAVSITPLHLKDTPYAQATAGTAARVGFQGLRDCTDRILEAVSVHERRFVYAYWPELDAIAHVHGIESAAARAHLHDIERALQRLFRAAKGTKTTFVVTADHGFVDIDDGCVHRLEDHPALADCLSQPLCGESRAAFCHTRDGAGSDFLRHARMNLGEHFDVHRAADLLVDGWFGLGTPTRRFVERVGDFVLVGKARNVIRDALPNEGPWRLVGVHGGVSEAEMRVPLLVVRS
jgi:hypothetical protein